MATVVVIDTNVLIRFLTKTPLDQYQRALALIKKVSEGEAELRLSAAVVGEVAAILHHVFQTPQAEVATTLLTLVNARGVFVEEEDVVRQALEHSRDLKDIDFIDAYVAAKAQADGLPVASFDKGLHKKLGTTVFSL